MKLNRIKQRGTVLQYNKQEGFGYIKTASGFDILVHESSILNGSDLHQGAVVLFEQHHAIDVAINVLIEN